MQLADLIQRTRRLTGVEMDAIRTDDEIADVINEAYYTIGGLAPWTWRQTRETVTLQEGEREFALPDPIVHPLSLSVVEPDEWRGEIRERPAADLDRFPAFERDKRGVPFVWAQQVDEEVEVAPTPDQETVVQVRGLTEMDELGDGDEPIWSREWHDVVAYEAALRILIEEGDDSGRTDRYRGIVSGRILSMGMRYSPWNPELPFAAYTSTIEEGEPEQERHTPAVPPEEVRDESPRA